MRLPVIVVLIVLILDDSRSFQMPVVFPSNKHVIYNNCLAIDGPFCVNATNYPTAALQKAIQSSPLIYDQFFDNLDDLDVIADRSISTTANRASTTSDTQEETMCSVETRFIFPQIGQTSTKERYNIVNTETYKQSVQIHRCQSDGESCNKAISLPNGYLRTECRQRYRQLNLLSFKPAIDQPLESKLELVSKPFEIPACCECIMIKST